MGSGDDQAFKVNFSGQGVAKLREKVQEKLMEFMGDYSDDTLAVFKSSDPYTTEQLDELREMWANTFLDEMIEEDMEVTDSTVGDGKEKNGSVRNRKNKRKLMLMEEAAKAGKRGICYLSRVPPHMDPLKLRQILSHYGEIQRIYLVPENPDAQMNRKRAGGFRGQEFSEGWVEFTKKSIAKRVAKMLNGQQMGGRKRSSFYYDIWNIKYLSKFKWDDLTEEIAYNNAVREQKLALELSAATKERDFFLLQADKSREMSAIEEKRLKKKQKITEKSVESSDVSEKLHRPKFIRHFKQKAAVAADGARESKKTRLSKDTIAAVFGGSS